MKLLIVDDEPRARAAVAGICARTTNVDAIAEADSGTSAIDAMQKMQPDLLLLEIDLPDMTGFDVLCAARRDNNPHAIVVSAHSEHAIKAFDVGVNDYLLKPVNATRLVASIERAARERSNCVPRQFLPSASPQSRTISELQWTYGAALPLLIGEREHRFYPLEPRNVEYIESQGNYVKLHTAKLTYISRDSIKRLAPNLTNLGFVRIERSLLVNLRAVAFAQRRGYNSLVFTLLSGKQLRSSITYRKDISKAMPLNGARSAALDRTIEEAQ
jgi:two-component system, LytTR family, response regulator